MEKHEWKKEEKHLYAPKKEPTFTEIPELPYFVLEGQGDPNSDAFAACIEALYAASYAVRMSHKGKNIPDGYYEYTVYPLEGIWDLSEEGRRLQAESGQAGVESLKEHLVFRIMIRQPSFVDEALASRLLEEAYNKKKLPLLKSIRFERICDGLCVQMLHEGPYDEEPASFAKMEAFCEANGLSRLSKTHREIYLSDARKTEASKLKTILRFQVSRS